jgi:hypothetical protein
MEPRSSSKPSHEMRFVIIHNIIPDILSLVVSASRISVVQEVLEKVDEYLGSLREHRGEKVTRDGQKIKSRPGQAMSFNEAIKSLCKRSEQQVTAGRESSSLSSACSSSCHVLNEIIYVNIICLLFSLGARSER